MLMFRSFGRDVDGGNRRKRKADRPFFRPITIRLTRQPCHRLTRHFLPCLGSHRALSNSINLWNYQTNDVFHYLTQDQAFQLVEAL